MTITIPESIRKKLGFSKEDFLLELAIGLFKGERLTLAQASETAAINQSQFQKKIDKRGVPVHYGIEELNQDLETLNRPL